MNGYEWGQSSRINIKPLKCESERTDPIYGVYEVRGDLDGVPTGYAGQSRTDLDNRPFASGHPAERLIKEGENVSITRRDVDVSDLGEVEQRRAMRTNEQLSKNEMDAEGRTMLNGNNPRAAKKMPRDLGEYGDRRKEGEEENLDE